MEMSSFKCLADLGMGDPFPMHQWPQVESIDDLSTISIASIFSENYNLDIYQSYDDIINSNTTSSHQAMDEHGNLRPSKQVKRVKNNDGTLLYSQPSGTVLNFSSPQSVIKTGNQDNGSKMCKAAKGEIAGANGGRLAQDHTMAERKRREKLSQRFIALSTLVPGLKKMDKASILGDAITHIKQLQEKVKGLEEQTRKKTMESVVFVMKFEGSSANSTESSSSDKRSTSSEPKTGEWAPEIGARFSDRDVLVNILCMKRKGIVEKTVAEIEKLHLSVVNSSVISFGDSALNITVCAQKDEEFNTTMEDLVKKLLDAKEDQSNQGDVTQTLQADEGFVQESGETHISWSNETRGSREIHIDRIHWQGQQFTDAVGDIACDVNIMSFSFFEHLESIKLSPVCVKPPVDINRKGAFLGKIDHVWVRIEDVYFPAEFMVVGRRVNKEEPSIILGGHS